jgi:hypothetical protein
MNEILTRIKQEIAAKVSPQNKEAFEKAVIAGNKIMFEDENTHSHLEIVKNPEGVRQNPPQAVAQGVAGLMYVMFMQSKQTMKYEVLIMAGVVLLCEAIDFAERGLGIQFDNKMIATATKILAENLFNKLGITPEILQDAIRKGQSAVQNQSANAQPPAAQQPAEVAQ